MNIGPRFYSSNHSGKTLTSKAILCALACLMLAPVSTFARTVAQKKQAAKAQFEVAENLRDNLEAKPESQRTRREFQKVMDAYRKVYYTAPSWAKADAAVLAVAELLDDQGRILKDAKSFQDAIGQYEFLRREYPGSKYRADSLFAIAEIYRDDLDNGKQAKATFEDFIKHYPGSSHAPDARKAIAEIDNPSAANDPFKARQAKHELVHVVQYAQMGLKEFASRYVNGFIRRGSYEEVPLEKHAYLLESRFMQSSPFSVEQEVKQWREAETS